MSDGNTDVWNIGTLHKTPIWAYYVMSNYVGVLFCAVLMYSVFTNPKKKAIDVMISGLCSGCLFHSLTCGTQCLLSMIHGRFYGGELACQFQAIAHISSILTQFFCVAGIAVCSYLLIVRNRDLEIKLAFKITVSIWVTCTVLTGLFSLFSPIYLMSNGTYCFFGFSSFAIAGWLLPGLVVALGVMAVCYYKIWQNFKRNSLFLGVAVRILSPKPKVTNALDETTNVSPAVKSDDLGSTTAQPRVSTRAVQTENARREISHMSVARRSALFMAILILGWGFAAITAIFELTVGPATEWLVTAVGVGATSFSWWMPLTYAYTSEFHKQTMKKLFGWVCIPCRGTQWWEQAWSSKGPLSRASSTISLSELRSTSRPASTLRGDSETPIYLSHIQNNKREEVQIEMSTPIEAPATPIAEQAPTLEQASATIEQASTTFEQPPATVEQAPSTPCVLDVD
jgi:hypothetical protein